MQILTSLTIAYAVVLVIALALSLITIAALLWRISIAMGGIKRQLAAVRDATAPLPRQLGAVAEAVATASGAVAAARGDFEQSIDGVVQPV